MSKHGNVLCILFVYPLTDILSKDVPTHSVSNQVLTTSDILMICFRDMCSTDQKDKFICGSTQVFATASVVVGIDLAS